MTEKEQELRVGPWLSLCGRDAHTSGPEGFGNGSTHPTLCFLSFHLHLSSFLSTHRFPGGKALAILFYVHAIKGSEEVAFLEGIGCFGDICFQVIHLS